MCSANGNVTGVDWSGPERTGVDKNSIKMQLTVFRDPGDRGVRWRAENGIEIRRDGGKFVG